MTTVQKDATRDAGVEGEGREGDAEAPLDRERRDSEDLDPDVVPDCTCEGGIVRL
jgi:hypothetical protein